MWYKHGPYSQALQNDILTTQNEREITIKFSEDAKKEISALKKAIFKDGLQYNTCQWLECLGSIQYIRDSILPVTAGQDTILAELEYRKPHLNNKAENKLALQVLGELMI